MDEGGERGNSPPDEARKNADGNEASGSGDVGSEGHGHAPGEGKEHAPDGRVVCGVCGRSFRGRVRLTSHMKAIHGEGALHCQPCRSV